MYKRQIVNSLNNLNDLVNRTTGIKVREQGGVGSDFDLSINGLSGNSVRYFLDGMPLDTKDVYKRQKVHIQGYPLQGFRWFDIGKPETLAQAEEYYKQK